MAHSIPPLRIAICSFSGRRTDSDLRRGMSVGALRTMRDGYSLEHMAQGFLAQAVDGRKRTLPPLQRAKGQC